MEEHAIPACYAFLAVLRFATAVSAGAGTEVLIGAQDRTIDYSFQLWVSALAIYLLLVASKGVVESAINIGG